MNRDQDIDAVETCQATVYGTGVLARARTCGKPVKRDGMCGVHAAAKDRRKRNDAKWQAERDADRASTSSAEADVAALAAVGIKADVYFNRKSGRHDGRVVVDGQAVLAALRSGERRAELDAGCQVCAERDQSEAEARDGLETAYELGGF